MRSKLVFKVLRALPGVSGKEACLRSISTMCVIANRSPLSFAYTRESGTLGSTRQGNFPFMCMYRLGSLRFSSVADSPRSPLNTSEKVDSNPSPVGNTEKSSSLDYPMTIEPPQEVFDGLSDAEQRKLKILVMEREVFRQTGYPVPRQLTNRQWLDILELETRSQRLKLYRFLLIRENHTLRDKSKKAEKRELRLSEPRKEHEGGLEYGLNKNSIFQMIRMTTMNAHYNHWQSHGILFGQSIVVDLGYDQHMSKRECANCADQIRDMYAANRINRDPFHFYLCNARPGDETYDYLQSYLPNLNTPSNLMSVCRESYLDVFPREKLVYLTPHCQNTLQYNHDSIYIIGGIVDKTVMQPVSLAKAKREGIAMARLPLDDFLDWKSGGGGGKSLTLDQMMKIMLDIKNTGDWNTAFAHVPKRKLRREGDDDYMQRNPKAAFRTKHSGFNKSYDTD